MSIDILFYVMKLYSCTCYSIYVHVMITILFYLCYEIAYTIATYTHVCFMIFDGAGALTVTCSGVSTLAHFNNSSHNGSSNSSSNTSIRVRPGFGRGDEVRIIPPSETGTDTNTSINKAQAQAQAWGPGAYTFYNYISDKLSCWINKLQRRIISMGR